MRSSSNGNCSGIVVGLFFLVALWSIDYTHYKAWTGPLMILLSVLILSPRIPGLGSSVSGAASWLKIGGVSLFQPSEPAKLIFIVVLAAVIAEYGGRIEKRKDVLRVAAYAAVPFVLILLQPDLGTGLVFIMIALGMLLVGGMKARWFAVAAVLIVIAAVVRTHPRRSSSSTRRTGSSCSSTRRWTRRAPGTTSRSRR